jgi:hypothetical protein
VIWLLARMGEDKGSFARTSRKTAEEDDDDEEDMGYGMDVLPLNLQ